MLSKLRKPSQQEGRYGMKSWFVHHTRREAIAGMRRAEMYIKEMESYGIPSRNVVLAGLSQGGAVALYTALNTR